MQTIQLGTMDLYGHVYGPFSPTGGYFDIKQDGATSLHTGGRKGGPKGFSLKFSVCFQTEAEASAFLAYVAAFDPDAPDFDDEAGADIPLYIRDADWHYNVYAVVTKPEPISKEVMDYIQYQYEVVCYCYSPYSQARRPATWVQAGITSLPATKNISNRKGHIASAFESLAVTCRYNSGHVKNLVHSLTDADSVVTSLTLCDEALSDEIWELFGNENKLMQTYEDAITSATKWGHDWTGDGTFDTDHMELDNGESAYIILSGPHQAKKPIKMTADLSLDSGGATGEATVDISPDGVAWQTVLDQDDFEAGSAEYTLQGTEYMGEIRVRISCNSGTSGKKVNIGSIKFEVERWIEDGAAPQIAAGQSATASIDAATGSESVDIDGEYCIRRKFL